jgi:rod shape-determining protein MreB and related proteins
MIFSRKIAIDLGTANSLVLLQKKGIVINEPSVVAVTPNGNKVLAVGLEAKQMIGRTPETIKIYRPLRDGVIADYRITQSMIKYFIEKVSGPFDIVKPELVISVPADISSAERRAVTEAALSVGAKKAYIAKEPILAALGSGIPIDSCSGHMIVDIGGGTSEVAVISLGGIVTCASTRVGGDKMDEAIIAYVKDKYNLAIGVQTAEEAKKKIGIARPEKKEKFLDIRGRDIASGLPRDIKISSNEVREAISEVLEEIARSVRSVLRETPPELSADIMNKGIILAGGGALLREIDSFVAEKVKVPTFVAEESLFSVIRGLGIVLDNLETYKKSIVGRQ